MKRVSLEELAEDKVLPYNLYDSNNSKLFAAGEVLTPGKMLQLKNIPEIYTDDATSTHATASQQKGMANNDMDQDSEGNAPKVIIDDFDEDFSLRDTNFSIETIDITRFKGPVNKKAKIDSEVQLRLKAFHAYILNSLAFKKSSYINQMYINMKEKIMFDVLLDLSNFNFFSELRLLGSYNKCHSINVAILSGFLAMKMGLRESTVSDVILGGLVHDIGKTKLPKSLFEQATLTDRENKIIQTHAKIGHKVLKEDFEFPENIAKIALEHHEHNNGSGYPYGKSGDFIAIESRIINVCNYFDNLVSNKTNQKVVNCHEACKIMLEMGSNRFSTDALYTFIHMLSYNDTYSLEDMTV